MIPTTTESTGERILFKDSEVSEENREGALFVTG